MKALVIIAHGSRREESNHEIEYLTNEVRDLVKNEFGATMQDLLFNSSKAVEPNIIYMTELGLLVKEGDKYKLHPDLKEFVDQKFK